jgi:hypothetical protein
MLIFLDFILISIELKSFDLRSDRVMWGSTWIKLI